LTWSENHVSFSWMKFEKDFEIVAASAGYSIPEEAAKIGQD
jgi:hypothetical protein